MTELNRGSNPRMCRSCGKLRHYHSEQELKECREKEEKYRQRVGRVAFSQCCRINYDNPQAVAQSLTNMYEALKGIYETRNGLPMDIVELARKALEKAESKQ